MVGWKNGRLEGWREGGRANLKKKEDKNAFSCFFPLTFCSCFQDARAAAAAAAINASSGSKL